MQKQILEFEKDREKLLEEINVQEWIFAKTYAKTAPHEYITRESNPNLFDKVCKLINKLGYIKKWTDGKEYRYLRIGNYREDYKYRHTGNLLYREKVRWEDKTSYYIPKDLFDLLKKKYKRCVYCNKVIKELPNAKGTPHNKATVEHFDNDSVEDPQEWNVVVCCGSCNPSRGKQKLLVWFKESYCLERNINEKTVAQPVKEYIKRKGPDA